MFDRLPSSIEEIADRRGQELAQEAIDVAEMLAFIRAWNKADPDTSVIASVDHLHNALSFDDDRFRQYDRICWQSRADGCEIEFMIWFSVLVSPTISASLIHSVTLKSQAWALAVLKQGPVAFDAPAPFPDTDALLRWILATVERPPIAGPTGETILDAGAEEQALRQALRAEVSSAMHGGWLPLPGSRKSIRPGNRRRSVTPGSRS